MFTEGRRYKCVVLGANGYLGSHMARHLEELEQPVYSFDRSDTSLVGASHYQPLDITRPTDFNLLPHDADYVFFFAGLTGTHTSFNDYEQYLATNELGLLHLLNHLRETGAKPRIIFPSSRLVYKGSRYPLTEESAKEAKTLYAAGKIAAEYILQAYSAAFDIPYTVVRICIPYGNRFGQAYSFGTIGLFLRMAREQGEIILFGDGTLLRTFTHVEDICSQVVLAGFSPEGKNQVFNIAGEFFSLGEVANMLAGKLDVPVRYVDWPPQDLALESGDTVFDYTKIHQLIAAPFSRNLRDWINELE